MTMKVDHSNNLPPLITGRDGRARSPAAKHEGNALPASDSGAGADATSVQLRSMESGMANPPVNASRLAEIKQAISEGRIQVNTSAVSESLIKSVMELISQPQA